ncbi:MAG: prepilin-type N-terminal cleavage/methylation domain-containing protein [Patescibacteria group bacterium]|nr:prepilin-type N-terminal cleavage/methylation domain-containing protein [Patescibacteria group bacterium]
MNKFNQKGQSLIEIIIGLAVGVIIIGGATVLIGSNLKTSLDNKINQTAFSLGQEVFGQVKSISESDWHLIYNLLKGPENNYYITSLQAVASGTEAIIADGRNFIRYFYVENVNRALCGIGDIDSQSSTTGCLSGPGLTGFAEDPSSQRITVIVSFGGKQVVNESHYLARSRNIAIDYTDWSGSSTQEGPITRMNNGFATSSNISATSTGSIRLLYLQ